MRAPNTNPVPEDFAELASGATLVIEGAERWQELQNHSPSEIPFGRVYGEVYLIQVDEVLACSSIHLDGNGRPDVSEFIVVVDSRRRPDAMVFSEWSSIFFLQSVFFGEMPHYSPDIEWRIKELDAIRSMAEEHGLALRDIYEPVYPENLSIFPTIEYNSFDYPGRRKHPSREIWNRHLVALEDAWSLKDYSDVKPFVQKALLPFFEQIDADWFIEEVAELENGEPLYRVGESLKDRREYEKKFTAGHHLYRKVVHAPFVAGSVLTNSNLTSDFPSFLREEADVIQADEKNGEFQED